ncbi:MAG: response regulator transcription factor [Kyrpidia sp.]|nr:response regulator transcription factor [Kyrpidia sp.]
MAEIRVLLVDHHLRYRRGLRSILELEKEMTPVGEVRDAQEVMDALDKSPADVVLIDLATLGDRVGEVVGGVKSRWPGTRVMVLADRAEAGLVEALCSGADGVLLKDVGAPGLVDGIRWLARVGAYLHPAAARVLIQMLRTIRAKHCETAACRDGMSWDGAQPAGVSPVAVSALPLGKPGDGSDSADCAAPSGWAWERGNGSGWPAPGDPDSPGTPGVVAPLTRREFEVLQLLAEGRSNRDIAKTLVVSEKTVKNHVASILDKLLVRDRTQAVLVALKRGWVKLT